MPEPKDKVTVWEAFDGKQFDDEYQAISYENDLWEKVNGDINGLDEYWTRNEKMDRGSFHKEARLFSKMEYSGTACWDPEKKKEALSFLKSIYKTHKFFENAECIKKDKFNYLN